PVRGEVRVVTGPQHPFDTDGVAVFDRIWIGDERRRGALLHLYARPGRKLWRGPHVLVPLTGTPQVVVVRHLREVREPPAVDLSEEEVQRREPVEHSGEDDLEHAAGRVVEVERAGQRHVEVQATGVTQADVHGRGLARVDDRLP